MKANGHAYTDEEIRKHIDWMKKGAKSEDLFDLIKYDRQHRANAFYWYQKIQNLLSRMVLILVLIFLVVLGSCCFFYWLATSLEPIQLSLISTLSTIGALICFVFLTK